MEPNRYHFEGVGDTTAVPIGAETISPLGVKDKENSPRQETPSSELYYSVEDDPPWHLTLLLGFQHYFTMIGATVAVPFIICPALCMQDNDPARAKIISTIFLVSGIVTLLQSTFGIRLPIVQGGSFTFIVPTMAILSLPEWSCPSNVERMDDTQKTELWQSRMREIQGAIIVASGVEMLLGFFGIVGLLLKYITPLTIAPAIAMIGLSLFKSAAATASTNWPIALLTMGMIILFSQYMRHIKISFGRGAGNQGSFKEGFPFFEIFPVLLSLGVVWLFCLILTVSGAISEDNAARTDRKVKIMEDMPWFYLAYPTQWGVPTVSLGAVTGMISAIIASVVESIGDYYACARISGAPPPPKHAINRGIFIEGFGCLLAGSFGTGTGTTSYSENIGAISITRVGSRSVIQTTGALMIVFSLIGKFGAGFMLIPDPIIGGLFCVVFSIVAAVGLSNLQGVDLNSSRNIFILGFSLFFGLTLSEWVLRNKDRISVQVDTLDQIIHILLSTGMIVSGFIGFVLDNTIPGTLEERGLAKREIGELLDSEYISTPAISGDKRLNRPKCYDWPFGMDFMEGSLWLRKIPISPTFKGFSSSSNKNKGSNRGKEIVI